MSRAYARYREPCPRTGRAGYENDPVLVYLDSVRAAHPSDDVIRHADALEAQHLANLAADDARLASILDLAGRRWNWRSTALLLVLWVVFSVVWVALTGVAAFILTLPAHQGAAITVLIVCLVGAYRSIRHLKGMS